MGEVKVLPPPLQHVRHTPLYNAKETNIKSLELFTGNIGRDIFDKEAGKNVRPKISKEEKKALKEIRSWNSQTVRVQEKVSCLAILDNNYYKHKMQTQINRNAFNQLEEDSSHKFDNQTNNWVPNWHRKKILNDKLKEYTTPHSPRPGKTYGKNKTHKINILQE